MKIIKIMVMLIPLILIVSCIQEGEVSKGSKQPSEQLNQSNSYYPSTKLVKDIAILNFNKEWIAIVTFELPTPCHNISFIGIEFEKNNINLFFEYKKPPKNQVCIQVIEQYNQTIDLGKLKSGNYTLNIFINEKKVWSRKFSV